MALVPVFSSWSGAGIEIGVIPETQEKPYAIAFPEYEKTSLAFSQGKDERLYAILPKRAEQAVKKAHWKPNEPTIRLGKVNKMTGGRMDDFRCPAIQVQVLGRANYVIYQTQKPVRANPRIITKHQSL